MSTFSKKRALVAGGTGLIGRPLVELLLKAGAQVRVSSLDDASRVPPGAEFMQLDLTDFGNCRKVCHGMDLVFNLLGVKGSPAAVVSKPATVFVTGVAMNLNLMEAARREHVEGLLMTSSIGVYAPADVFREDDVWKTFPSKNDWFGGWAKRAGELQVEAYRIEHRWEKLAIVRPANVYGPFDNFDSMNAMVVPSLIKRAFSGENPFVVWGDGTPVRDFIHAEDVARGMLLAAEKWPAYPINLGSGTGVTIRRLVEIVVSNLETRPEVKWDTSKSSGDSKRLMDMTKAEAIGFVPSISLEKGIHDVMEWYRKNHGVTGKRYDVFDQKPT